MIIVRITGGLGNQMFQYSFGKYLSIKYNTKLKFDIQTSSRQNNFTSREFDLLKFHTNIELASKNEIEYFKIYPIGLIYKIKRKLCQMLPYVFKSYRVEISDDFDKNWSLFRNNCYYDGYWQSEKYFKPIEQIIRGEFILKDKLSKENIELLTQIKATNSISIHIRRGDYLTTKPNIKLFNVCTLEYYVSAIEIINNKTTNPVFYIFSEDMEWAKANFFHGNLYFVDRNIHNPEIDLILMSNCKHNIIANSTFSWWAAWLNSSIDKIIISPKHWYVNKKINKVLIPESWIKI